MADDTNAVADTGTQAESSPETAPQQATQTTATSQDAGQPSPSKAEGSPVVDSASPAPSTERHTAILREAGYTDEDIKELGPAAARVAGRYEAEWNALADSVVAARKAPEAEKAPEAPKVGTTAQTASEVTANDPFEPFIKAISEQYDPELAKGIRGMLEAQAQIIRSEVQKHVKQFEPVSGMVSQWAQQREADGINGFFAKNATGPYAARYGSDPTKASSEQLKARQDVVELAVGLKQTAAQRGQNMTGEQALMRAHLSLSRDMRAAEAVQQVQKSVVTRSKQISIPPGTAGSGSTGTPKGDPLADAKAYAREWSAQRNGAAV